MSRMGKRITAVTLTFALTLTSVCGGVRIHGVTPEVKEAQAAEVAGKYVLDVRISHKSSKAEAEQEMGPDYTVLDKDFNDGMSGHAWIGYSTTDDPDHAIKDIKVMGMDGKYSESDYKTLLDNHKQAIEDQLETVIPAIIEYAKNYDAGMKTAANVCTMLNMFYEDDSGKNMGDLLLEMGRAFDKDSQDSATRATLKKMFVEGNNSVIVAIENLLVKAGDTKLAKEGSWLTRMSLLGPDGLMEIYKKQNSGKSKSFINNQLATDFGDDAKVLLDEMSSIREIIKEAEESELAKNADDESAVDEMVSEVVDAKDPDVSLTAGEKEIANAIYQVAENASKGIDFCTQESNFLIVELLKTIPYGETKTMYDFFTNENIKKSDLYTMAYVLSNGQKNIVNDVGVFPLFEGALTEYSEEEPSEIEEYLPDLGEGILSVYEGVDRAVFDGDTAITDETIKNMETRQVQDVLIPGNSTTNLIATIIAGVAGIGLTAGAIRAWSRVTKEKTVQTIKKIPKQTSWVTDTLQKNIKLIKTYDTAFKFHYLEKEFPQYSSLWNQQTLFNIEFNAEAERTVNKLYTDSMEALVKQGGEAKEVAKKIELLNATDKEALLKEYEATLDNHLFEKRKINVTQKYKVFKGSVGSRILFTLGAVAAFAFAGYEIYCMTRKETVEFTHMPANMVSRTYGDEVYYVTYHAATNASGDTTDLHDKKGKGWQVIYTTNDNDAGDPILASSLRILTENVSSDPDEIGLLDFDGSAPSNLTNKTYTGKDMTPVYIFFKTGTEPEEEVAEAAEEVAEDEAAPAETETPQETAEPVAEEPSTEGAVFGGSGIIWIILIIVVVAGGAAGAGVYFRKRKKL